MCPVNRCSAGIQQAMHVPSPLGAFLSQRLGWGESGGATFSVAAEEDARISVMDRPHPKRLRVAPPRLGKPFWNI